MSDEAATEAPDGTEGLAEPGQPDLHERLGELRELLDQTTRELCLGTNLPSQRKLGASLRARGALEPAQRLDRSPTVEHPFLSHAAAMAETRDLHERLAEAEAERDRYRKALERLGGDIDKLHDLVRDMLQSFPDTADEQQWRDRAGRLEIHDPDGQPYRAHTEDDL